MNPENEDLPYSHPEISAVEAVLAQLRPSREARFADKLKGRLMDALSDRSSTSEDVTATVRVPLTHYIRIAQFNAAAGGLLAGLLLGVLLGGTSMFFALSRFGQLKSQAARSTGAMRWPYVRVLLENDASHTPLERAFLDELDEEPRYGRK